MTPVAELFTPELTRLLIELRHDIHRNPELSFEEEQTASRLESALGQITNDVRRVAGTGVVARLPGTDSSAPTVALRGDIDALPITEQTGLPYCSENPGAMHACGHDVHATWAVAAAHLLAAAPARGDVIVLLQPGEESGVGAPRLVAEGVLDGVSYVFGAHVDRRFPIGKVVAQEGPLAASSDTFTVTARGGGAHGARPHEAADPIHALSQFVVSAQGIVSRKLDPSSPAVVTVGQITAGNAPNVIPTKAVARGTIRATTQNTRDRIHEELRNVVAGTARTASAEMDLEIDEGPGPVVNPPEGAAIACSAVTAILGAESIVPLGLVNMAAEDFAAYLQEIPGCFLRVGARYDDGEVIPAHSPRFYAEDESIFVGGAVLAECARQASAAAAP